ncbi:MAG: LuxR family transcriptional regulator [Candidatus Pseudomonas phytovorans]|uniref:LuxR family transcriptional regulator n=1 Tax=Candidatus Pseudomonas phytovorans TaxID=3121377 RepID=A0AAJ6BEC6_9PSED|nr:LuxR family transcriptional regulator [Pseudomonas sp.]WEK31851.1 MAG: LuxR family transcriptional regulator [Pseudomonas sp.]
MTVRECEIAQGILSGLTSKQIAHRLGVSDLTVRKHRENLYRKLNVHSLAELARHCREQAELDN